MASLELTIGNKNYSSWSMRPWVLMRQAGLPFSERLLRFDDFQPGSPFKTALAALDSAGKVPVLRDGEVTVWDSLAICEYLAERFPDAGLWPADRAARAHARSLCAEMHAGYGALRNHCPMNIEALLPEVGARVLREQPGVAEDLARIVGLWSRLLERHGGPMLFGDFGIADAYFAPVVMRIRTYALPVPPAVAAYLDRVEALPGVADWVAGARAEKSYVAIDEPYRSERSVQLRWPD
ncbi:glutathione S-transferase family protein [Piscinibacter sakaiensis]|uniref:Glutathione S-transferase n=1 Tax=Piscinibacter sakaiensis TaxID=1547922 RepID=A0A0K8P4J8_PISS1|nr:glutathione S-transferase family protein [Piscinibacter sakaiensis]GAP37598.1 glutathione S-transferase [Piscinibacter sakaiensis]